MSGDKAVPPSADGADAADGRPRPESGMRTRSFGCGRELWGLLACFVGAWLQAEEPAKDKPKPEPPVVRLVQPIGIEAGTKVKLKIRGQHFNGTNTVRVAGWDGAGNVPVLSQGEAKAVSGVDAGRIGDRQVEVELTVPAGAAPGTNALLWVGGATGESPAFPLLVLPAGTVTGEKEPNDGFRTAPGAKLPVRLRGAMEAKGDVDVFRVELKAGKRFRGEVQAARWMSTLDAMLTVYDSRFAVVASVDYALGRDPVVEFEVKESGEYFVAVSYANDQTAPTHEYVLVMEER